MSTTSGLSVILGGLLVIGVFSTSIRSPNSSRKRDSFPTQGSDRNHLTAALNNPWQTGPNSELPRPVKKFSFSPRTAEIDLFSFKFERPYLGHEGPNFTELEGEPSAGAQYLATAELFREEAVSTARFELVDKQGKIIQPLHFFKYDNSLEHAKFFGSARIPEQPFRVAVSGTGIDGEPYRRIFQRLFQPTRQPPAPPILPKNLSPREAGEISSELKEMERQALAKLEERTSKDSDRMILMPRIEISNVTYQSFTSERGNKLGLLLSYDIRFSVDGDYAHSLQVFPFYDDDKMRGLVELEIFSEEINPKPQPPSYATPQIYFDLKTLVKYGSEAWYQGGVVYHFTIKLIPNFVGQNANHSKFCVDEQGFRTNPKSLQLWQEMKQDQKPIAYRIFMYPLAWGGETEPFDAPKVFYDGFLKEGAVKCLPYKNVNF